MTGRGHDHEWTYERLCARPVRKMLIIKLRAIGDVLLSTVVLPNLRSAFPDAQIDFLTEHPASDVVRGNPYIDNAIIFHTRQDSSLRLFIKLYRARYDLVFDLFCNPRSAQMAFATRAPVRVGYPFRGRAWAYNVHVPSRSSEIHNTEFNLDPLAALGIPVLTRETYFPLTPQALEKAASIIVPYRTPGRLIVALNPSGTWETKRWGLEHFAELADTLATEVNAVPILLWGPGEEHDVETIRGMMKSAPVIPPKTTLTELGALLSLCDYTISNDSGPMHISAAVGTPTLGIFGPTNPYLQGPFHSKSAWVRLEGLECLACNLTSCNIGNICMKNLPVSQVFQAFLTMKTAAEAAYDQPV